MNDIERDIFDGLMRSIVALRADNKDKETLAAAQSALDRGLAIVQRERYSGLSNLPPEYLESLGIVEKHKAAPHKAHAADAHHTKGHNHK
jgi:hypothetical protein